MNEGYPVIRLPMSIVARWMFALAAAGSLLVICFMPRVPPLEPHLAALLKSGGLLGMIASVAYFMTTKAFDMCLEFRPGKFVFTGFRRRYEIPVNDIAQVYYRGWNILPMAANLLTGLTKSRDDAVLNPDYVDEPHLIFVLKSGQKYQIQIDSSVAEQALAYLRDMLVQAGHTVSYEQPRELLERSPPEPPNVYVSSRRDDR